MTSTRASKLPKVLPAIHPNVGVEMEYRRKLYRLVADMDKSVKRFLEAAYKANEPMIAQDELPAAALRRVVRVLAKRWQDQFDEAAERLAKYFSQQAYRRSSTVLEKILKDGGLSVKFKMTRTMQDVMNATIGEQVGLIRSIPQKYFTEIEGAVMRSVQQGRDLHTLSKFLQDQYGVTKRRAALIARDQNNKATASMLRVRQQELGFEEAIWVHSHGGKEPRPSHLKNDGKPFNIKEGWYDPDEGKRIWPGELINCRCISRVRVPGTT